MGRAGFESQSWLCQQSSSPSPGCDANLPSLLCLPIFRVMGLFPESPSSVSLGKMSLIYFRLDLHAHHKDYHPADSSFAYFFCLTCSGFVIQALQPILALLGLWECQNEGIGTFVTASAQDSCLPPSLPCPSPWCSLLSWHKQKPSRPMTC